MIVEVDTIYNNCYLYVKSRIPNLPRSKEITGNSIAPVRHQIVILQYAQPHYAFIEEITETGIHISDSNFGTDTIKERFLSWQELTDLKAKYHRVDDTN